jgi:hypothetical protein
MIQLIATIVIIASSVLLFGYWFRYACRLILTAKTAHDYTSEVATANQLSFPGVQSCLQEGASADLDRLRDSLDRDYAMIAYLLRHTANLSDSQAAPERYILAINYRVMRGCYRVSRRFSVDVARRVLEDMSLIVAHLANTMGEQAARAPAT